MERLAKQRVERPRPAAPSALVVGPVGDAHEREADHVARQVGRGKGGPVRLRTAPTVQRRHSPVDPGVQRGITGARGSGRPLPDGVRSSMEQAMGADFGGVRVHTDTRADQLSQLLQARAFTTGQDIFFRRGEYNPSAADQGRETLAHELTHVVQQSGTPSATALVQRRIGFEFETTVQLRGAFTEPVNKQANNLVPFENDKMAYSRGRWRIDPDCNRIEFVSDPVENVAQLKTETDDIEQFIAAAKGKSRQTNIRAAGDKGWKAPPAGVGKKVLPQFTVHVGSGDNFDANATDSDWLGQPQVSVGVKSKSVAEFLARAGETHTLQGLKQAIGDLVGTGDEPPMPSGSVTEDIVDVPGLLEAWTPTVLTKPWVSPEISKLVDDLLAEGPAAALPEPDKAKLRGLWMLMAFYWARLVKFDNSSGTSYKKIYLQAMARTDFHSFHNDLSQAGRNAYSAGQAAFIAGAPKSAETLPFAPKITLRRWYESVKKPETGSLYDKRAEPGSPASTRAVDLLSANTSKTNEPVATGTDKSMGQYPLDGKGDQAKVVFELRRLTPGTRVPMRLVYTHLLKPISDLVDLSEKQNKNRKWQ